ncbi:MAG: hypothetical protein PHD72_02860 [Patescibacteria group bacterium]|nr:hypothetical protein [Patescibacteria group bacterium]
MAWCQKGRSTAPPTALWGVGKRRSEMEKRRVMSPVTVNMRLKKWKDYTSVSGRKDTSPMALCGVVGLIFLTASLFFWDTLLDNRPLAIFGLGGGVLFTLVAFLHLCLDFRCIWELNVRGNNLWITRLNDLIPEHREIVGWVVPRGQVSYSPTSTCAIVIPLGGWFNEKPRISYGPEYQFQDPKVYWHLGSFHPTYDGSITNSTVTIKTRHGEEASLTVGYTLDLFNQMMADNKTPPVMPLGFAFFRSMRAKVELEDETACQQAKIDELLDISTDTIRAIAASKRFGNKSKDGARIRKELTDRVLEFLPADDPRRKMFEPTQPDA